MRRSLLLVVWRVLLLLVLLGRRIVGLLLLLLLLLPVLLLLLRSKTASSAVSISRTVGVMHLYVVRHLIMRGSGHWRCVAPARHCVLVVERERERRRKSARRARLSSRRVFLTPSPEQNERKKPTWMPARVKRLLRGRHVGLLHRVAVRRGLEVEVWSAAAASTAQATATASAVAATSPSSLETPSSATPSAKHFLMRSNLRYFVSGDGMSAMY